MATLDERVERLEDEVKEIRSEMQESIKEITTLTVDVSTLKKDLSTIKRDVKITRTDNKKYGKLNTFLLCLIVALFAVLFSTNAGQARAIAEYMATNLKAVKLI